MESCAPTARRAAGDRQPDRRRRLHPVHRGVYAVGHRARARGRLDGRGPRRRRRRAQPPLRRRPLGIRPTSGAVVEITVPRRAQPPAAPRDPPGRPPRPTRSPPTTASPSPPPPARSSTSPRSSRTTTSSGRRPRRRSAASEAPPPSPTSSRATRAARGRRRSRRSSSARDIGRNITKRELELRFLAFLDAHRLPRPRINATVESIPSRGGRLPLARPPPGRRARRLRRTHGTRTAFEEDRARDRALLVAGYRVTRITWRQLAEGRASARRRAPRPPRDAARRLGPLPLPQP